MRKKELYRTLVERYLNRTASPEELQVFFHLLEQGELKKQLLEATQEDHELASRGGHGVSSDDKRGLLWGRVRRLSSGRLRGLSSGRVHRLSLGRVLGLSSGRVRGLSFGGVRRLPSGKVRHMVRRYGAAAAIFACLVGIGGFLLWKAGSRKHEAPAFVSVYNNDIDPGRDRAILTRRDGSQVALAALDDYSRLKDGPLVKGMPLPPGYHIVSTPAGGQYRLTLVDGTKVWLNSQSSIRFPTAFDGKTRLVEVSGEAFFDVAKDARRPFVVKAGRLIVQALGTQFNVHAYADEPAAKATLIQGSVRVIEGTDSLLLTPGQEGEANLATVQAGNSAAKGDVLALNNAVDTAQAAAWKEGYFDFDNQDIAAIMRQFERWYDIRVVFAERPNTTLFAGRLQRSLKLSQVMIGLGRMGVHSRLEGRTLTILP